MKDIVLSGIRATGQLHLGNYFGALRNFVKMQEEGTYDANYFIADLHALTTAPDPNVLHANVKSILAEYLAAVCFTGAALESVTKETLVRPLPVASKLVAAKPLRPRAANLFLL